MKISKNMLSVDFIGDQDHPITEDETTLISAFLANKKKSAKKTSIIQKNKNGKQKSVKEKAS
jgi:hypothetical protein